MKRKVRRRGTQRINHEGHKGFHKEHKEHKDNSKFIIHNQKDGGIFTKILYL